MSQPPDQLTITPLYTPAEELNPPVSTYVISGGSRIIIVDPGPAWHIGKFVNQIARLFTAEEPLVVVVQSPGPVAFDGLPTLTNLSKKRSVVIHWKAAAAAGEALIGWHVQTLTTKSAGLPISSAARLTIGISSYAAAPGALLSFERSTGTLFSGPFLGSMGPGQNTGKPALRRESVRAYRDVLTPNMAPDIVESVFGSDVAVNQIAPTHGRMTVGGSSLIRTLFRDDSEGAPIARALYQLFVRAATLIGEEAVGGIFRANGVPVPKTDSGYRTLSGGEVAGLAEDQWTKVLEAFEQWIPGPALASIYPLAAAMVEQHNLPASKALKKFARAACLPPAASGAKAAAPASAIGTADMPGTVAVVPGSGTDEITDSVTGLMNETVFKQRLAGQFRSRSEAEGLGALILISVDKINRINTTYGRKGGDEALYTVAYLLRNFQSAHSRRGTHRLYKLTGPTFGYVLAQGSVAEGAEVADRIRRSISESAMFLEQLTVSVGVIGLDEVSQPAGQEDEETALAAEAASRAFARLKIAQQGGSNTVCSSDPTGASVMSAGSTVLVADPDAPYLEMLTRRLEDQGYTVLLARDGAEAGDIIGQIVPDAIVAEVMLPKKNGFALREELRHDASLSNIPFILVSHRKSDETIAKAALLGIVHFLAKPFSLVELTGLLRNLTGSDSGATSPAQGDH